MATERSTRGTNTQWIQVSASDMLPLVTQELIAVVMPAYNEAEGIGEFLREIHSALPAEDIRLVVADDASTDGTAAAVEACRADGLPVEVLVNTVNRGHGPTTIAALVAGLERGVAHVVAVDGDGQFMGEDIAKVVRVARTSGADVVEGVRTGRDDPAFRRATSWVTREMVRRRSGVRPKDANTPLRVYRASALRELLAQLPEDAMTPNLLISVLVRSGARSVVEETVASIPRRGDNVVGSSWKSASKSLPSRRFVRFCWDAGRQWTSA